MWEVMHVWVIVHNIIIEREHGDPLARDDHPYDHEGLLSVVDH
jgi:hypothetical protein